MSQHILALFVAMAAMTVTSMALWLREYLRANAAEDDADLRADVAWVLACQLGQANARNAQLLADNEELEEANAFLLQTYDEMEEDDDFDGEEWKESFDPDEGDLWKKEAQ